jgi:hypothetical protein
MSCFRTVTTCKKKLEKEKSLQELEGLLKLMQEYMDGLDA